MQGKFSLEIPYASIQSMTAYPAEKDPYLRINHAGGEEKMLQKTSGLSAGSDSSEDVIKIVGPRLPADAKLFRKDRPVAGIKAFLWDHFGDPPQCVLLKAKDTVIE